MSLITPWPPATPDLDSLRWKNRILLIFATGTEDKQLKSEIALIDKESAGFEDRDFRIFTIAEAGSAEQQLRSSFHARPDEFLVVLIGKDGSEKLRSNSVVAPQKIFHVVDSMPMRRAGGR